MLGADAFEWTLRLMYLLSLSRLVFGAAAYNETLDDTNSAIRYSKTSRGGWAEKSCKSCIAKPNPEYLYDGTWQVHSRIKPT